MITYRSLLLIVFTLLASGCALSPQNVDLQPHVTVSNSIAVPHAVRLTVEDHRPQNHLGTRGGVYSDTSYITPRHPLEQSLYPAALAALQQLGLDTRSASPQPIFLTIVVEDLSYKVDGSKVPKKVTLNSRILVRAVKGSREHSGRFDSSQTHSFVKLPNEEENQRIINDILSQTLTRLFNDTKLLEFIASR